MCTECFIILLVYVLPIQSRDLSKPGEITFDQYQRYQNIQDYLYRLNGTYKRLVTVEHFGVSVENRNLTSIKISTGGNFKKPLIFIDAGIHAREWIGPAQALYVIHRLVENPSLSSLVKNVNWLIVPLVNPDGYEYSHMDRLWRKNRAKGKICDGVDLNRNFDFQWLHSGASRSECSNNFAGVRPFSEPESLALSKIIAKHAESTSIYISLHAAAQSILYPWGYTTDLPDNGQELHDLAQNLTEAVYRVNSTQYKVGSSANILYADSGTSRDWAYAVANIKLAYTIELKGFSDSLLNRRRGGRFDIPPEDILNVVSEMFEGIKRLHSYVEPKHQVCALTFDNLINNLKRIFFFV
ncbi:carboxypeptidase B-like isoform X2 [Photinus pyralis]|uniref:carboxypeptidase B-like isoform X2 n=1 Tax=Photinus pyralis TaxID=7054 RepID=UPI0012675F50|nr:carboxypeptidase B-like isoform X2 [Photinus pyralis]